MSNTKRITVIEPINTVIYNPEYEAPKKKVAAYARVSTELEEQENSYEAQVEYYTNHIQDNPDWEFIGVYADRGISGTSTKRRESFNRMVEDAKAGKIDIILTKSISRFARNTVDALRTVRELRNIGCEVIFEKEGLSSFNPQGDTVMTIMANLAEEESRSISENVKWGQRRSMQAGNVAMAYGRFLGYRKGPDGKPEIIPKEAEIVKEIYQMFLDGMTINNIAKTLTARGIPTPAKKTQWSTSTVRSILSNEKYKGDALRQKTYTVDYLTKTVRKNKGELKQYYIANSHPAIIDEDTFELVQIELASRAANKRSQGNNSPFTTKIICGDCGSFYGHKVSHSGKPCQKDIWYCNHRFDGEKTCTTPIIPEDDLKTAYLTALSQILDRKDECIADCRARIDNANKVAELRKNREKAEEMLQEQIGGIQELVHDNAKKAQDQEKYRQKYDKLYKAIEKQKGIIAKLKLEELDLTAEREKLRRFMKTIEKHEVTDNFQANIWNNTIEKATVNIDKTITFMFKNSVEINIKL